MDFRSLSTRAFCVPTIGTLARDGEAVASITSLRVWAVYFKPHPLTEYCALVRDFPENAPQFGQWILWMGKVTLLIEFTGVQRIGSLTQIRFTEVQPSLVDEEELDFAAAA